MPAWVKMFRVTEGFDTARMREVRLLGLRGQGWGGLNPQRARAECACLGLKLWARRSKGTAGMF